MTLTDRVSPRIRECVANGRISWTGPLVLLVGRSAFMFVAQAIFALVFMLNRDPSPWRAAAPYWTVYGTLVDLGCLTLVWRFTRTEGTTIRGLIGTIRWRRVRDLFAGFGYFFLIFPFFVAGGVLCGWILYGTFRADPIPGILSARVLPAWAIVYSCSLWWMIWSPTEEITYQGYVLPRIEALTGHTWIAVAIVGFWWALQHSFLPFVPDWRSSLWRFMAFPPGVFATILVYVRTRRLAPLIVAHWMMDILGMLMTTRF